MRAFETLITALNPFTTDNGITALVSPRQFWALFFTAQNIMSFMDVRDTGHVQAELEG